MFFTKLARVFRFINLFLGIFVLINGLFMYFLDTIINNFPDILSQMESSDIAVLEESLEKIKFYGLILMIVGAVLIVLAIVCFIVYGVNKDYLYTPKTKSYSSKPSRSYVSSNKSTTTYNGASTYHSSSQSMTTFRQVKKDVSYSRGDFKSPGASLLADGTLVITGAIKGAAITLVINKGGTLLNYGFSKVNASGNYQSMGHTITLLHFEKNSDAFILTVSDKANFDYKELIPSLAYSAEEVLDKPGPYKPRHEGLVKFAWKFDKGFLNLYNMIMDSKCMDAFRAYKRDGYFEIFEDYVMMLVKHYNKIWNYMTSIFNELHNLVKQG